MRSGAALERLDRQHPAVRQRLLAVRRRLLRSLFGDRLGLVVFLTIISVYALFWRVGILITDTYTVANTFVAVSEGQLHVERAVYGTDLNTPGMGTRDGRVYGRNYGQVILALPFLWAIQALATVAELRVALAALWALALLGLTLLVGRELDRPQLGAFVGSGLALAVFAGVVHGATPLDPTLYHLVALQLQGLVAAAFVGVVLYRLLVRAYGRRIGVAAGLAVGLATPVGFWAPFPKRHVLVTLCAVLAAYFLFRSREGEGVDARFRAAAYAPVCVAAWVSGVEGAILLIALLAVDVPTGGRNLRSLSTAAGACVLAALPMFVTNLLVTGSPVEPPRSLTYGGGSLADRGRSTRGETGDPPGSGGASGVDGAAGEAAGETFDAVLGIADLLADLFRRGLDVALSESDRFYNTFVRGGYIADIAHRDAGEAIRLSFLESMPLAAGLLAIPVFVARRDLGVRLLSTVRERRLGALNSLGALGTVDAFAVVYTLGLTLVYLPRLPLHATVVVRYLLPVYPLAIYGLVRLPPVRRVLAERSALLAGTYASGLLVGGQLLVVYLWGVDATRGEAMQAHALVGLGTAALLAGWIVADSGGHRDDRVGAIALGLAAAAGTVLLVLCGLWHFSFVGPRALPLG